MKEKTPRLLRLLNLVLCATGVSICAALVKEHAGPWPSLTQERSPSGSLCTGRTASDPGCAAVLKSHWSEIAFDLPIWTASASFHWRRIVMPLAFVGLCYFVFLGVWHAFAGPPKNWGRWYAIPLTAVLISGMSSVVLVWIMLVEIGQLCKWCMATHAINGLLIASVLGMGPSVLSTMRFRQSNRQHVDRRASCATSLRTVTVLRITGFAGLTIVGLWAYWSAKMDIRQEVAKLLPYKQFVRNLESDPKFLLREFYAQPMNPTIAALTPATDATDRPTASIVFFSDFECPYCACFAAHWEREYQAFWTEPISVSFLHFPLCHACNLSVAGSAHPKSCDAALAAEAARMQGGREAFWAMHNLLFRMMPRTPNPDYAAWAAHVGLNGAQLVADMHCEITRHAIERDVAIALEAGVVGTPSVFVNGRQVPRLCVNNAVFWKAIAEDLESAAGDFEQRELPSLDARRIDSGGGAVAAALHQ